MNVLLVDDCAISDAGVGQEVSRVGEQGGGVGDADGGRQEG